MAKDESDICAIAKAAAVFCGRWTPHLIHALGSGSTRFLELDRALPLTPRSLLARRLKELEREGIIVRRPNPHARGSTYHLTPAGRAFLPLVEGLASWGRRWTRRRLAEDECDPTILLWEIEGACRTEAFGQGRTVILFEFADQPQNRRYWWVINENGKARLCLEDPGFDVDLHLCSTLVDMIRIWHGDLSLTGALRSGQLEAMGPAPLRLALSSWLFAEATGANRRDTAVSADAA